MWHSRQEESSVFLCSILHPLLHVWQFLSWWIKAVSIFKIVQIILFIFSVTRATAVHDLYKDLLPTDITGSEFCLFVCLHHLSDAENSTEKSMASSMHLPPQHCLILLVVCLWWEPGLKAMNILQWARMGATLFGQKQNKLKDSHAWRERKIQDCWQAGKLARSMTESLQVFDTNEHFSLSSKKKTYMHLSLKNKTQTAEQYVWIEFTVVWRGSQLISS